MESLQFKSCDVVYDSHYQIESNPNSTEKLMPIKIHVLKKASVVKLYSSISG